MNPGTRDYLLAEYKWLREEIMSVCRQMEQNETWALIVSGAIWSCVVLPNWNAAYLPVLFAPAVLALLFAFRWFSLEISLHRIAAYLRDVEKGLDLEPYGWETRLGVQREQLKKDGKKEPFVWFHRLFWAVLIGGNLLLACVYWVGDF